MTRDQAINTVWGGVQSRYCPATKTTYNVLAFFGTAENAHLLNGTLASHPKFDKPPTQQIQECVDEINAKRRAMNLRPIAVLHHNKAIY